MKSPRSQAFALRRPLAAWLAAAAIAGCGDGPPVTSGPDAGDGGNARLVINEPPGDMIGLSYGGRVALEVTYVDAAGAPIPGARVSFSMVTGASESTGGSTLSANAATAGAGGVAGVDLIAGAEPVNFRVEASAPDAPSAVFYVSVSEEGFTDLVVTPFHDGFRSPSDLAPVEVRLYRTAELGCADLDVGAIPESVFPPRAAAAFGDEVVFRNVSSGDGYAVVAWAEASEGIPASLGCLDLAASQVRPQRSIRLDLAVADRDLALPGRVALGSRFDLTLLRAALEDAGLSAQWDVLACPAGPGQLLLDCSLDALAADGALDCTVTGEHPIADAVEAERGPVGDDGCRATSDDGAPTLDRDLTGAVTGDGFPSVPEIREVAARREEVLSDVELDSVVTFETPGSARHELRELRLSAGGDAIVLALAQSARPVVVAEGVSFDFDGRSEIAIGRHGFTLRLGSAAAAAFRELALAPVGLAGAAGMLGQALAGAASDPDTGTEGCAAVSAIACAAAGEPGDCLESACAAAAPELDDRLSAWARRTDGAALDLALSGAAPVADDDGDVAVDGIGVGEDGEPRGSWAGTLFLAGGDVVELVGSFAGQP